MLVVYAALAGNLLVTATKAVAAVWTGSSAMLSEAIHSLVDTGNEVLLLYGSRRAAKQPDADYPLGYGRELYFWSFIVALLIFAVGAGMSIFEGVNRIQRPEPISDPMVNYLVLGLSFLFEGGSWLVSMRQFRAAKGERGYYQAFRKSKDPRSFMVFFEDSADLLGITIAAAGIFAAVSLNAPAIDGFASILIGLILGGIAILLARESKSLLIGERADHALSQAIVQIAAAQSSVSQANGVLTVQLAPDQIMAAINLDFVDHVSAAEIENSTSAIERKVRAAHPEVIALFIKPQSRKKLASAANSSGS